MARITFGDVKTSLGLTESYDIINAIRNSASSQFQQYVPLANAENVADVSAGILVTQAIQNEFIASLVDRIGLVVMRNIMLKNELAKFKKGMMPLGRTIEEIFVDISKEHLYDAEESENAVFKREIPDAKTLFHERNRQGFYKQTIQDDSLKTAFISWGTFEGFLAGIINSMYNSAEVDEFKYMKLLIDNYFSKSLFTVVPVLSPDTETAAREFIKKVRATARKMSLSQGSRDFNALAVQTKTDMRDMHLIIDADTEAEVDVDVLARAFNMDKTEFLGNVTVIDGFASTGLEAILVDREWFMVYDTLVKMETIRNPQGLYWNYFYHIWQVLSTSRFANAVAFVSGAVDPITQIIVDPVVSSLKQGKSMEFTAYVRTTDGKTYPVTWAVLAYDGSVIASGTAIDANGNLTLGATQTGTVQVTASATFEDTANQTTLTANASIGAKTLAVADSSNFKVGDTVIVGTETTPIAIESIPSSTSITLVTGLVAAQTSGAAVYNKATVVGTALVTAIPTVAS